MKRHRIGLVAVLSLLAFDLVNVPAFRVHSMTAPSSPDGLLLADQSDSPTKNSGHASLFASPLSGGEKGDSLKEANRKAADSYGRLPLAFEENKGQASPQVKFASRGAGYQLFLTPSGATMVMARGQNPDVKPGAPSRPFKQRGVAIGLRFIGATQSPAIEGVDELSGRNNYLAGSDPANWYTGIRNYRRVVYHRLYPGVDLAFHGENSQLEYDLVVAPQADVKSIRLSFEGVRSVRIDRDGNLVLMTRAGEVKQLKPTAYQQGGQGREEVVSSYRLVARNMVGFRLGMHDPGKPLVIDPVLAYSTFLGGTSGNSGMAVAVDSTGAAYVTGTTTSFNFPTTPSAFSTTYNNANDVFVSKLDPTGATLVYSTFVGGSSDDTSRAVAIDSLGNAYVAGQTSSPNFPTTPGAFQTTFSGSFSPDAFVFKLSTDGSTLVYSTFLGGANGTEAFGIALDASENAYVAGATQSTNFPTTAGAFQTVFAGGGAFQSGGDAFITKLNTTGTALVYSTFLGGSADDTAEAIAVDSSGDAFVTGNTLSSGFPTTAGAFQTAYGGQTQFGGGNVVGDAFATELNPSGSALVYSTFLGGSGDDSGLGIALDSSGDAFIAGATSSSNYPTTAGTLRVSGGGLFKSINSALNWGSANSGLASFTVSSLAIDPTNSNTLYAATPQGGVFKSTSGGGSWTPINSGLPIFQMDALAIDPSTTSTIYLGSTGRGMFKSTDSGGTWRGIDNGENGMDVADIAVDPSSPTTVFAATDAGLFKTTNGGNNWVVSGSFSSCCGGVSQVKIDPANHLTIYAVSSNAVWKSTDGGNTWSRLTQLTGVLAVDSSNSNLFAGGNNDVLRSTDGGNSWVQLPSGIGNRPITALAARSGVVYAGTAFGVFKSINSGDNWTQSANGMTGSTVSTLAIDPGSASTIYAGTLTNALSGFVTEVNPTGTALLYSTYLGGNNSTEATSIALDSSRNAYVTGFTSSTNFPVTPGGYGSSSNFEEHAFVSKLNTTGSGLVYSTNLSGTFFDEAFGVAVDSANKAYVTGFTQSQDFPTTTGAVQTTFAGFQSNAFISSLDASPALSADLSVVMDESPSGTVSNTVQYTITLTNNGPDTAYNVLITDDLPLTLLGNNCFGSCANTNNFAFAITKVPVGSSMFTVTGEVNCGTPDGATITNKVSVTSDTPDPLPGNNSAMVSATASVQPTAISPNSESFTASGGFGFVGITAPGGCISPVSANAPWITINGSGSSFVDFNVAQNTLITSRTGTITIGSHTFTVNQMGITNYIGFVDVADCNSIGGWAADRNRVNTSINVELFDGSNLIAIVPAFRPRPDVAAFLGDNGLHGFTIPIPASLKDGNSHSVHIEFEASGSQLSGSPATISCPRLTPNYVGFVDVSNCNSIGGWAADRNRLNQPISVSIYDGTTLLVTLRAGQVRTDVGAFLGDNGLHGFSTPTPAALKTGTSHNLRIQFETGNVNLTGSPVSLTCP